MLYLTLSYISTNWDELRIPARNLSGILYEEVSNPPGPFEMNIHHLPFSEHFLKSYAQKQAPMLPIQQEKRLNHFQQHVYFLSTQNHDDELWLPTKHGRYKFITELRQRRGSEVTH